jgi:hypothetical protein
MIYESLRNQAANRRASGRYSWRKNIRYADKNIAGERLSSAWTRRFDRMLNHPNDISALKRRELVIDQEDCAAEIGDAWRIGDAPLRWDVSLTDRIQAALRQCVSRRVTLGHTLHHRRVA